MWDFPAVRERLFPDRSSAAPERQQWLELPSGTRLPGSIRGGSVPQRTREGSPVPVLGPAPVPMTPGREGSPPPRYSPVPPPIGSFVASPASPLASTADGHRPRCIRARPRLVRSSPGAPGTAAYGVPIQL